jgi:hypothetical protein
MKHAAALWVLAASAVAAQAVRAEPVEIANAVYGVTSAGESASCEAGDIALGGGGTAPACIAGTEAICGTREHPVYDGPLADGTGWRFAVRNQAGTIVTTETYATCLDVSSHPELAGIMYLQTATGFAVYEVDCETGDLLVGGGAEPTPTSAANATLELDYPINLVEDTEQGRVYAGGWAYGYDHLVDAYYDNNTNLAVCLTSTALSWWASVYLVQQDGIEALCDAGDKVLSGGGTGPRCDSGSEPACLHPVQYSYDGPFVDEDTGRDGWRYGPYIQGVGYGTARTYAICARADPDNDGVLEIEGDCGPDNPDMAPDIAEICGDGLDNNCNTLTDYEDPACPAPEPEDAPEPDAVEPAGDTGPSDAPDTTDAALPDAAADAPSDYAFDSGWVPDEDAGCGCAVIY